MSGFSLMEVLMSLLLVSLGLTFVLKEEMNMRFAVQELYYQSIALYQIVSIRERLRVNQSPDFQAREIQTWNLENAELLPNGNGEIHRQASLYDVSISWGVKKLRRQHSQMPL